MGRSKRMRNRAGNKTPKPRPWAGEPSELELELERKIAAIEAKYKGVEFEALPRSIQIEYGRLHSELLAESQRRSGLTLIKITQNPAGDGATYDGRAFYRVVEAVQMLIDAGMSSDNAIARAFDDEQWRQQRERETEPDAGPRARLTDRIKDIFRPITRSTQT